MCLKSTRRAAAGLARCEYVSKTPRRLTQGVEGPTRSKHEKRLKSGVSRR